MALEIGAQPIPEELCWPLDPACLTDEWYEMTPQTQDRAAYLAIQSLRSLTGYRVGGCPIVVRPCRKSCCPPGYPVYEYGRPFTPLNYGGVWTNCCSSSLCSCSASCEVTLPGPVGDVIEVLVDGAAQDLSDYRIDNGNILVYEGDDECPFNMEQDLSLPTTEVGTWSVEYLNSYPPDATAAYAAGLLALEFGKACTSGKCKLPPNVTDMTRNGVSFTIITGAFPDGLTGIRQVDTFIRLWKPEGSPEYEAKVWTPGNQSLRHTTRSLS